MSNPSPKELAFVDLDREISTTRKVLERLPEEHLAWTPHEKSMPLGRLAMHVTNLLQWMLDTIRQDELDVAAAPPQRDIPTDRADILRTFDANAAAVRSAFAAMDGAALSRPWSLRSGPEVLHTQSRDFILRVWCVNHLVHHRGQLCLYLRLLNVPVPAVYFSSADEPDWVFT